MVLAALSLLSSILILAIHHHSCQTGPPEWLQRFAFHVLGRILCVHLEYEADNSSPRELITSKQLKESTNVDETPKSKHRNGASFDSQIGEQRQQLRKLPAHPKLDTSMLYTSEMNHLHPVVELVKLSTAKLMKDEATFGCEQHWKDIAKIFDRFLLVIFVFVAATLCVVLLVVLPLCGPTTVEPIIISWRHRLTLLWRLILIITN